jgi:hypothetical protein
MFHWVDSSVKRCQPAIVPESRPDSNADSLPHPVHPLTRIQMVIGSALWFRINCKRTLNSELVSDCELLRGMTHSLPDGH